MIFWLAAILGLFPLAGLSIGGTRNRVWRWMAYGFAVSLVADVLAWFTVPAFISQLYPVTQAAFFVFVLAPRRYVEWIIAGLLCLAAISVTWRQAQGLDVLLHVTAWGTVAVLARCTSGSLRTALLVYFALGSLAWMGYVASPGWTTWLIYQGTRLAGVCWWCLAIPTSDRETAWDRA